MRSRSKDLYFSWLVCQIDDGRAEHYNELLVALYETPFGVSEYVNNDINRATDGFSLRNKYIEKELPFMPAICGPEFCSMLEMMVALAIRMEDILYDSDLGYRVPEWFWDMIKNLGFLGFTDDNFDDDIFNETIDRFMTRTYEKSGHNGGLFTTFDQNFDMRDVEIWYQMQHYIIENQF